MKKPIMGLELDPCRRQQIQGSCWDEFLACHEALAQHPWTRIPQLVPGRLRCQRPREIAAKPHAGASHQRHFSGIEFAIRVPYILESLISHGFGNLIALQCSRRVAIVQVVLTELDAQSV